jgi:hypothetical protein
LKLQKPKNMKKFILMSFVAATAFACNPKTESATTSATPKEATGYILDSSANIELAKKSAKCLESGDTATYRSTYSKDAIIHENMLDETVDQNMAAISAVRAAGITTKIDAGANYFENVYYTPKDGHTNFVSSFMVMTFSKGGKEVKVFMHATDAIKDGLQVEEWLNYDTKAFAELMK